MTPEDKARQQIDAMLAQSGWTVQDRSLINLSASLGVAVREVSMKRGHGEADYLLFAAGKALGTIEAKPAGRTLHGVETQSQKYVTGIPFGVPSWATPLPFSYESTGVETHFTNGLDPEPRSRPVFAVHRPETLAGWVQELSQLTQRMREFPPLITDGLWPAQVTAITNLEGSLAANKPRALIQMATGSGKTFTAVNFVYRLIKFADARRVLFLVDRGNLGKQTLKEFQQFVTPDDGRKFPELYNIQRLQSNQLDRVSRVCIATIQRVYSMLKGESAPAPDLDDLGIDAAESLYKEPLPVEYNSEIPIETFDFIITDECHRSIYNLWRQVLEYFDAHIIGLTATPSKQTLGFFNQNLVMEYPHEKAVADGVNVNYDVYRIHTEITESGSKVEKGFYVDKRHRQTRKRRWELLDEDLTYAAEQLDRDVVSEDQIRTVLETFHDRLFAEIFPGRTEVPKTLIYAKDDSHADDIVRICREVFDKGNDFCQKITYRTTGAKPDDLIASFRNSYNPRIAVTVDMIATGTDIKPLEIVFFMRSVRSRGFFEQMKGRGVRVIPDTEFQAVTPDAKSKTHFVIVDAVGVCERDKTDSAPLERKRTVPFSKLLEVIALGNREPDALSSLAGRLLRLDRELDDKAKAELCELSGGHDLRGIASAVLDAIDPDVVESKAKEGKDPEYKPTAKELREAMNLLASEAVAPLATQPEFRHRLIELQREAEQTIDTISQDRMLEAGFDANALEAAQGVVQSFRQFIAENKDEITALQILYNRPYRQRLTFEQIRELANVIEKPPRQWTPDALWRAYERIDRSKVFGSGRRVLTDLVSLVGYTLGLETVLRPFSVSVKERFETWIKQQETLGRKFTAEQREWLGLIRDHVATSLAIGTDDFELSPFNQKGGLGRAHQLFGSELPKLLDELNEALAA
ncbi:MAG: DEAD/DEAH box helicase family protein [Candidatus Hydrogenedentes bacterium]|nr:DEAD/DEAH box helicase family protein [Candidatus Hydrogenedentota bacterium]